MESVDQCASVSVIVDRALSLAQTSGWGTGGCAADGITWCAADGIGRSSGIGGGTTGSIGRSAAGGVGRSAAGRIGGGADWCAPWNPRGASIGDVVGTRGAAVQSVTMRTNDLARRADGSERGKSNDDREAV